MSDFLNELNEEELNKHQINKKNWLLETEKYYTSENTIKKYWRALEDNGINSQERLYNKDLYDFSREEIVKAINHAPTISFNEKISLFTIISKYIGWADDRGFNNGNPCDTISVKDIKINKTAFDKSYIDMNTFYAFLETLESSYADKMILVLARYGVEVDDMPYVKWDDVDRTKYLLSITNRNNELLDLPIDDMFLYYLDKAKLEEFYEFESEYERKYIDENGEENKKKVVRQNHVDFIDYGYILKLTSRIKDGDNKTMLTNTIRNKVRSVAINNTTDEKRVRRPKVPDYNKSRKYDLLFEKLNSEGIVTRDDLKEVIRVFDINVTASKIAILKKNFELLADIEIN